MYCQLHVLIAVVDLAGPISQQRARWCLGGIRDHRLHAAE
jgi:hypothetical protein